MAYTITQFYARNHAHYCSVFLRRALTLSAHEIRSLQGSFKIDRNGQS